MELTVVKSNYQSLIFDFRGYKVMIDFHLASLYGVGTKQLKRQVRRNIERFPEDFMFELNKEEFEILKSQIGTSSSGWGGVRHLPMVFTEHGISMLSSVLKSKKAIQINIEIMRAFTHYRALLRENTELRKEIKNIDEKLNKAFQFLLGKIDALHQKKSRRTPIGYKIGNKK